MTSAAASALWTAFRDGPKQIEMELDQRREAGEHAEDITTEPEGVVVTDAPDVDGLWIVPHEASDGAAVLYLFGGGYVLGSPHSRWKTAGHVANASHARVLVPNYRLAPEHKFPAAVEDAVAAYRFLCSAGAEPDRIVLAGDSSGGGLAVALALALRDAGDPLPAGVVALSPWADLTCSSASMETRSGADVECTKDGLLEMAGWYLNGADPRTPTASPVFADLSDLPALLAVVGGDEVLLDDSARLVTGMGIAGGAATLDVAGGMQHVYPIWVGAFPEAGETMTRIGAWIRSRTA